MTISQWNFTLLALKSTLLPKHKAKHSLHWFLKKTSLSRSTERCTRLLPEGFPALEDARTCPSNGLQDVVTLLLLRGLVFSTRAWKSSAFLSPLAAPEPSWAEAFTGVPARACQITLTSAEIVEMNSNSPVLLCSDFNEHITSQQTSENRLWGHLHHQEFFPSQWSPDSPARIADPAAKVPSPRGQPLPTTSPLSRRSRAGREVCRETRSSEA